MPEVSFCQCCYNRLSHAEVTIPRNLATAKDWDAEFVVIDYGSTDGLRDFIRTLSDPKLKYFRHESQSFKCAHAKNMAHRLSIGRVVCNLDIDNFVAPESFDELCTLKDNFLIHGFDGKVIHRRVEGGLPVAVSPGAYGRISVTRSTFDRLGGYDEQMHGMGYHDSDFIRRAASSGVHVMRSRVKSECITHDKNAGWLEDQIRNKEVGKDVFRKVNPNGYGIGEVTNG
jgi:glycosyltransferase involved in cell wall biosynthesis